MKGWGMCGVAWVWMLGASAFAQVGGRSAEVNPNRYCGIYSAGVVMALGSDVAVTFDQVKALVVTDEKGHSSLMDVARGLRARDIDVSATVPSKTPPDSVCIAAVPGKGADGVQHFVTLRPIGNGRVLLYSPPYWVTVVDWKEVYPTFSKPMLEVADSSARADLVTFLIGLAGAGLLALLFRRRSAAVVISATTALCLVSGCSQAESSTLDLEVIGGADQNVGIIGASGGFDVKVAHRGEEDLVVKKTSASCGCAVVGLRAGDVLKAGQVTTFRVAMSLKPKVSRKVDFSLQFEGIEERLRFSLRVRGPDAGSVDWQQDHDLGIVEIRARREVSLNIRLNEFVGDPEDSQRLVPVLRWQIADQGSIRIVDYWPREPEPWTPGMKVGAKVSFGCEYAGRRQARLEAHIGALSIPFIVVWDCRNLIQFYPDVVMLKEAGGALVGRATASVDGIQNLTSVKSNDANVTVVWRREADKFVMELRAPKSWRQREGDEARATIEIQGADFEGKKHESTVKVIGG